MSKKIIYCMTTIVPGLVKIGKTGSDNFEQRMYTIERNGYANVVGLKREFAIEVEDYDEKEILIHELFSKSNLPNTELFATDVNLVVQLLSSLEGKQIYPKEVSKEDVFDATVGAGLKDSEVRKLIPNGVYYLKHKKVKATMVVENGKFIVQKGCQCLPCNKDWMLESRRNAVIENGILMKDAECGSPSGAGWVVLGSSNNGWVRCQTKDGQPLEIYRK